MKQNTNDNQNNANSGAVQRYIDRFVRWLSVPNGETRGSYIPSPTMIKPPPPPPPNVETRRAGFIGPFETDRSVQARRDYRVFMMGYKYARDGGEVPNFYSI